MLRGLLVLALVASACGDAPATNPPAEAPSGDPAPNAAAGTVRSVDAATLAAALEVGPVRSVDLRTAEDFATGHVPGAINVPEQELALRIGQLAPLRHEDLYLLDVSGRRSARVAETLSSAGFAPLVVTGGLSAWKAGGFPME